jgi:DNA-binding NtrC family response regulator
MIMNSNAEPIPEPPTFVGRRVLIVDDEPLIRWSLGELLAGHGYTVSDVPDGGSAVRALTGGGLLPDLVLLDFRLPDSNDLKLLGTIVALVPGGRVILMTAFSTAEVTRDAVTRGAFAIINKPFDIDELTTLLDRASAR